MTPTAQAGNAPPGSSKRAPVFTLRFTIFLLGLFAAVSSGSAYLMIRFKSMGSEEEVPALTGKTVTQATTLLARRGFILHKEGTAYHETAPAGGIVSQDPAAGEKMKKGRAVKVVVSSGPALVEIPEVRGKPFRGVEILLRENRLRLGEAIRIYCDTVTEGEVIAQEPMPGAQRSRETAVSLLVSKGPGPRAYLMPDFAAKKWPDVLDAIKEHGLYLGKVTAEDHDDLEGRAILAQYPKAGEKVWEKSPVALRVAAPSDKGDANFTAVSYQVPGAERQNRVKIVIMDEKGSREIYNDLAPSGKTVSPKTGLYGRTWAQFFVNNELVEEKWIQ